MLLVINGTGVKTKEKQEWTENTLLEYLLFFILGVCLKSNILGTDVKELSIVTKKYIACTEYFDVLLNRINGGERE